MAIYFKGTLENNSLFLGHKTNVRECLKIILMGYCTVFSLFQEFFLINRSL